MKNKGQKILVIILCVGIISIISYHDKSAGNLQTRESLPQCALVEEEWNLTWGGVEDDWGRAVAIDLAGNILITGMTNTSGSNGQDAFIAKYTPNKVLLWNYTYGTAGEDDGFGVTTDQEGNVFLAGWVNSTGLYNTDAFIAKYTPNGTQIWNNSWGYSSYDRGYGISVGPSGAAYLVGSCVPGNQMLFIVKYAPNGLQLWNRTWSPAFFSLRVAVDGSDNAYVVAYNNAYVMGTATASLLKYAPDGTLLWNRTWGEDGKSISTGVGVAVDREGNPFISGYTNRSGTAGKNDSYLAKYSPSGTLLWNHTWGGVGNEIGGHVAVDGVGYVYLEGTTDVAGTNDVFLVKYSSSGTFLWDKIWGGAGNDLGLQVASRGTSNVYLVGTTDGMGAGKSDAFLVRYTHAAPEITILSPSPGTAVGEKPPTFTATVSDPQLVATWYDLGTGTTIHTFTAGSPTIVDASDWAAQPNGNVLLRIFANNSIGDVGYAKY